VNTIDLDTAKARGVAVANMPGTNSRAVAEHSLLLMLATLRRVTELDRLTRAGEGWTAPLEIFDQTGEIGGRTVGLLGYGGVAGQLAPVLTALGAKVIYHARTRKPQAPGGFVALDELFQRSDILSLHLPLTVETEHLVNAHRLQQMPAGSVLVNTARGGLVDETALLHALERGPLRAAGLDTFGLEPVQSDNPLLALPNLVVTPHVAWLTPETLARSLLVAMENCRRVRDGEALLHRVV
jgi:phosphoglycerate dehydrogenase-like enzyme